MFWRHLEGSKILLIQATPQKCFFFFSFFVKLARGAKCECHGETCFPSHVGTPEPSLACLEENRKLNDLCSQVHNAKEEPAGSYQSVRLCMDFFFAATVGINGCHSVLCLLWKNSFPRWLVWKTWIITVLHFFIRLYAVLRCESSYFFIDPNQDPDFQFYVSGSYFVKLKDSHCLRYYL